jgi:hypothetical protein
MINLWRPLFDVYEEDDSELYDYHMWHGLHPSMLESVYRLLEEANTFSTAVGGCAAHSLTEQVITLLQRCHISEELNVFRSAVETLEFLCESRTLVEGDFRAGNTCTVCGCSHGGDEEEVFILVAMLGGYRILHERLTALALPETSALRRKAEDFLHKIAYERGRLLKHWTRPVQNEKHLLKMEALRKSIEIVEQEGFATEWDVAEATDDEHRWGISRTWQMPPSCTVMPKVTPSTSVELPVSRTATAPSVIFPERSHDEDMHLKENLEVSETLQRSASLEPEVELVHDLPWSAQ